MVKTRPILLIADDSPSIRRVIRNTLEAWLDADLLEASDGVEAERILQEQNLAGLPVDVVILDWMMPELSGLALLVKMRAAEYEVQPRVVMLTAETYPEQIAVCLKFGVSSYLTKPFTEQELVEILRRILTEGGFRNAV